MVTRPQIAIAALPDETGAGGGCGGGDGGLITGGAYTVKGAGESDV